MAERREGCDVSDEDDQTNHKAGTRVIKCTTEVPSGQEKWSHSKTAYTREAYKRTVVLQNVQQNKQFSCNVRA